MDDTVNLWMLRKDFVEIFLLSDIDIIEVGSFARDELDATDRFFRRVQEIIHNHDFIICF